MPLTAEQLELRKTGIGASEIAAIAGLDPWRGAYDIWLDKCGLAVRDDDENEAMEWGNRLEAAVAQKYAEDHPEFSVQEATTRRHPVREWMLATPDRLIYRVGETGGVQYAAHRLLEVKTAGWRGASDFGEEGTDDVPEHYLCQVQWCMGVTGVRECDLAVLIAGRHYRVYMVALDEALLADMVDLGESFWYDHVVPRVAPPISGTAKAKRFLSQKYAMHSDHIRLAVDVECILAADLQRLEAQIKELEGTKSALENALREGIGNDLGIEGPFGRITWGTVPGRISWKDVAAACNPPGDLVARFTSGPTRRMSKRWKRD